MMIIAAHQPNFLPYMGFWRKVVKSDLFVLLDDVQFTYKGADSYTHRTKIKNGWLTLPVVRREIGIKEIDIREKPYNQIKKILTGAYRRTDRLDWVLSMFEELDDIEKMSEYNIRILEEFSKMLGLEFNYKKSSELDYDRGLGKDYKLDSIFREVAGGGDFTYYSGLGAKNFIVNDLFKVEWSDFKIIKDDDKYSILHNYLEYGKESVIDRIMAESM